MARLVLTVLGCLAGMVVLYTLGTVHFCFYASATLSDAMAKCVIPFIPFELVKCVIASLAGLRVSGALSHLHMSK